MFQNLINNYKTSTSSNIEDNVVRELVCEKLIELLLQNKFKVDDSFNNSSTTRAFTSPISSAFVTSNTNASNDKIVSSIEYHRDHDVPFGKPMYVKSHIRVRPLNTVEQNTPNTPNTPNIRRVQLPNPSRVVGPNTNTRNLPTIMVLRPLRHRYRVVPY